jgi:hypothetical protein
MVFKIKRQWKITFLQLAFFGQFGLKIFIPSQKDRVEPEPSLASTSPQPSRIDPCLANA